MVPNPTPEQRRKLDALIKFGCSELEKIKMIREGLNDDVKALAEELDVKPKHVMRSIRIAHKSKYGEHQEDYEVVNQLLESTGRNSDDV